MLLLVSLFGNGVSCVTISLALLCAIMISKDIEEEVIELDLYLHLGMIISELVAMPLLLLPYLTRIIQLNSIYSISQSALSLKENDPRRSSLSRSHIYREQFYLFIYGAVGIFYVLLGALLAWQYVCQTRIDLDNYFRQITAIFTMSCPFVVLALIGIFGALLLSKKQAEVNMNTELIIIFVIWIASNLVFYAIYTYFQPFTMDQAEIYTFMLVAVILSRNCACLLISVIIPIFQSNENNSIPYGETRECVNNVELALSTELPLSYFSQYIEQRGGSSGKNILGLEDIKKGKMKILIKLTTEKAPRTSLSGRRRKVWAAAQCSFSAFSPWLALLLLSLIFIPSRSHTLL